jgi:hypothetical protein
MVVQQIPVERLEVSNVENNPVPLRNRALIQRIGPHNAEERIASPACIVNTLDQIVTDSDVILRS